MSYQTQVTNVYLGYADGIIGFGKLLSVNSFTATGLSPTVSLNPGETLLWDIGNTTWVATISLQRSNDGGSSWKETGVSKTNNPTDPLVGSIDVANTHEARSVYFRWSCSAYTSGTVGMQLSLAPVLLKSIVDARGTAIFNVSSAGVDIAGDTAVYSLIAGQGGVTSDVGFQGGSLSIGDSANVGTSTTMALFPGLDGPNGNGSSVQVLVPSLSDTIQVTWPASTGNIATTQHIDPGEKAVNQLRVASNVVSAETVTIGANVYEIEIVNTDTTDNTSAANSFNNTTDPLTLATFTTSYPNTTIAVGGLLRLENEIIRCTASSGGSRTFSRGQSGTTTAAHADSSVDIFKGDGIAGGSTIAVGMVTTLTPTVFTAALVDDINGVGTVAASAEAISANEVLLYADSVGVLATACTETLGGANNAWTSTTMYGGAAGGRISIQKRVPLTQEVTLGNMHFHFDFAPTVLAARVAPTATPGVAKAWDGAVTVSGNRVTLDNSGATDWAATDTVVLTVTG